MALVEPDSREWFVAWQGLAELSCDHDREAEDEEAGEVWQYMGSLRYAGERVWFHTFRHRWHPRLKRRWVLHVPASETWEPAVLSISKAG